MNITQLETFNLADAVKFHNNLNPLIWDKSEHLHKEIREQLLAIAADFSDFLGVKNLDLRDITISGSNAAFSYTPHSDIDLHLIVDLGDQENSDIYRELFDAKKYIYNNEHDIKIKNIPVELYVQDANQKHHSQGIYSILNNNWIEIPRRRQADIDDVSVKSKYNDLSKRIKKAIKSKSLTAMTSVMDKIREMRSAGLAQQGEFGPENLAFKLLRNKGDLKKLQDARKTAKSIELSLKEREAQKTIKYGFGADYIEEVGITPDGTNPSTAEFTNEEQLDEVGVSPDGTNPSTCMFANESKDEKSIIEDFINFCINELQLNKEINLRVKRDPQWSVRNKTFGRYNDSTNELEVSVGGRHIMDVLRTVGHELVHQKQNELGSVPPDAGDTGSDYENEANAKAGVLMRQYGTKHPELFVPNTDNVSESEINETVEDEKFLQQVANGVEQWAEKFKATNKQKITGFVEPGKIGKITGIKGTTPAQNHLLNLGMMFLLLPKDAGGKNPLGAYRPAKGKWGGDIGADIRYLIPDATLSKTKAGQEFTRTLISHETDLASTIAHELRHALDDYLSKGKYDSSAHKYDYHDQTVEINAFFTQALKSLQQMIDDGIVDRSNLQWAMRRVFYNNELIVNLIAKKDPRIKRLLSRAYTYLQSELNKNQQLKEATGYIPTEAEKNDPRFEMAITVDVKPGAIGRAANAFLLNTDSQGHPQELRPDGKVKRMMEELNLFKRNYQ